MAHGDSLDTGTPDDRSYFTSFKLLDAAATVTNGRWVDVRGYALFTLDVSGLVDSTVQLRASNAATLPANTFHGTQIGADITQDGMLSLDVPVRWLKCRMTSHGTDSVNAILQVTSC